MPMTRTIVIIAILVAAAARGQQKPDTFALVIGIDEYPEAAALKSCVKDAKDITVYLSNHGVPGANIHTLVDREATAQAILRELDWIRGKTESGGDAFVYYSGHGGQVEDLNHDEKDGLDETWVAYDLEHVIDDIIGDKLGGGKGHITVVSDSCHSGTVTRDLAGVQEAKYLDAEALAVARSKRGMAAPKRMPSSREVKDAVGSQPDGGSPGRLPSDASLDGRSHVALIAACSEHELALSIAGHNSVFTDALLEALGCAPANATFAWLRAFTDARIRSKNRGGRQHPAVFGIAPTELLPSTLRPLRDASKDGGRCSARALEVFIQGMIERETKSKDERSENIASVAVVQPKAAGYQEGRVTVRVSRKRGSQLPMRLIILAQTSDNAVLMAYPSRGITERDRPNAGEDVLVTLPAGCDGNRIVAYLVEWDPLFGVELPDVDGQLRLSLDMIRPDVLFAPPARKIGVKEGTKGERWDRQVVTSSSR